MAALGAHAGATLWCLLGLYEGGYKHGLKNLAYAAGLPDEIARRFFPPALYEPPGDFIFELQRRSRT